MSELNQETFVFALVEGIKTTYEQWGIDMMSMFEHIEKDFPNAARAIKGMYCNFNLKACYELSPKCFDEPQFVYEMISNFISPYRKLKFNIWTRELSKEYRKLNICSWSRFQTIYRIDLLMAILLFTEEFAFEPISSQKVQLTEKKLTIHGTYVKFTVSKLEDRTYISIRIRNVMILTYVISNYEPLLLK